MLYLILCILCTSSLIFSFKLFERFRIHTFQAIVVNYITCFLVGIALPENQFTLSSDLLGEAWVYAGITLGLIFVITFYLIALTTQRVGVTAASVATKISLVIPVLFSLLVLQNTLKDYDWINYLGMVAALAAVVLTSLRPSAKQEEAVLKRRLHFSDLFLPIIVFLNSGLADALINYTNHNLLETSEAGLFTMLTFTTSAAIGSVVVLYQVVFKGQKINFRSILGGFLLGIPNYFSIYFLLKALTYFQNDGAFLFPVNNIGIILTGTIGAVIIFGEKFSRINILGILIAVLALVMLSYQEIFSYLF